MAKRQQPTQPYVGVLTQEDFSVLRQLIHDFRSKRINSPLHSQEQFDHQAPETYVGITLEEIPALRQSAHTGTGTGSGTGAEGDIAGKGNCRLVRIMNSDDTLDRLPTKVEVFNISDSAIPSNKEVILVRDKFGKWLIVVGGGGGSNIIRFSILSAHCEFGWASVVVLSIAKGTSGVSIGDFINVCDADGCFLTGPSNLLNGRVGWAAEMSKPVCTLSENTGTGTGTGTSDGQSSWAIFQLCVPDIEC